MIIVQKQLKTYLLLIILAALAIYLSVFNQQYTPLPADQEYHAQASASKKEADTPSDKAHSLEISSPSSPIQAVKSEEIVVSVTERTRPSYNLFYLALQLLGFENRPDQISVTSFCYKPISFSAPIYILFRQLII